MRHSSSASRCTAGAAGFLILSQWSTRPARYGEPSRFDTDAFAAERARLLEDDGASPSKNGIDGQCRLWPFSSFRCDAMTCRLSRQKRTRHERQRIAGVPFSPRLRPSLTNGAEAIRGFVFWAGL